MELRDKEDDVLEGMRQCCCLVFGRAAGGRCVGAEQERVGITAGLAPGWSVAGAVVSWLSGTHERLAVHRNRWQQKEEDSLPHNVLAVF
jgi:hypothetical protein